MTPTRARAQVPFNTTATLAALAAGLVLGAVGKLSGSGRLAGLADLLARAGSLWTTALQWIAIPLIVCLLVVALAGSSGHLVSRLGSISVVVFVALLLAGALLATTLTPLMLRVMHVEWGSLATSVKLPPGSPEASSGTDIASALAHNWLLTIIGLAIVVALAVTRIGEVERARLLGLVESLLGVVYVILSWLLSAMPVAVFALAYAVGARSGLTAPRVAGSWVVIVVVQLTIFILALYPAAVLLGRIGLRRFASAAAPAQSVAISTRSSLASLPALLEAGAAIGMAPEVSAFVMPLTVSSFKANLTVSSMLKLLFLAQVYGIILSPAKVVAFAGILVVLSFVTPGTPGAVFSSTPALLAMGIPMEGIVLLTAVDAVPDMFKTLANVTANLTAGVIVARFAAARPGPVEAMTA